MTRWLETDTLSNQNISSALLIATYTADADRLILMQPLLDQVVGGGNYKIYVTLQVGGAGSAYVIIPKSIPEAEVGETAIGFQSGYLFVRSGDVVKVYIKGLITDTTTPDTTVRFAEIAALRPTTADRTLDVSAGGEAGIDWANVGSPETVVNLTGTSVLNATEIEIATTAIQLDLDNPDQYKADVTNLDATISSRAATGEAATAVATLHDFDYTNEQVIVGTNNDKEDYSLSITGVAAVVAGVWDELQAGHVIPDSFGDYLDTEVSGGGTPGAIADAVWDEVLSGHETGGTAGRAVGRLGSGAITTVSIVAQSGDVETYRGDSYLNVDGRRIEWTDASADWPTLTGTATIAVEIGGDVSFIGVIIVASGDGKEVGVELTAIQSATIPQGKLPFAVRATLTNGSVITLLEGTWTSKKKLVIGS